MSHVEEGTLQAWIDGELRDSDLSAVESHAASCAVCLAEVRSLRDASEHTHQAISVWGDLPVADFGTLGEIRRRARPAHRLVPAALARAAMLLLALAGVVAAAVPGSPLRRWIDDVRGADESPDRVTDAVSPTPTPEVGPRQGGVFVRPEAGVVTIRLVGPAPGLMVRVVDDAEAGVVWTGPDEGVRSRQSAGLLEVSGLPGGPVTVTIPRSALSASVVVNGRIWWEKAGPEVRIPGPAHEERGDEVLFQTGN